MSNERDFEDFSRGYFSVIQKNPKTEEQINFAQLFSLTTKLLWRFRCGNSQNENFERILREFREILC